MRQIRNAITPILEKKREEKIIGASLEAKVSIFTDHTQVAEIIRKNIDKKELPRVFVVSQVEWMEPSNTMAETTSFTEMVWNGPVSLKILVERAEGSKCMRCWNYSSVVGTQAEHPGLCGKCLEALRES